jgi:hypothetical protein
MGGIVMKFQLLTQNGPIIAQSIPFGTSAHASILGRKTDIMMRYSLHKTLRASDRSNRRPRVLVTAGGWADYPTGKSLRRRTLSLSSPLCKNISVFQKSKSRYMIPRLTPPRGVS